jgi:hypothetical protein
MRDVASAQWTIGVLVGVPLLIVFMLVCLGIIGYSLFSWRSSVLTAGITFLVLIGGLIGALVAYWPLKAEYHQYRSVSGTVAKISSRLIANDNGDRGGTSQKFVVVLTSGPQPYGVNDTRAALIKPGDTIHLKCKRTYEYGSDNAGYDCKWSQ